MKSADTALLVAQEDAVLAQFARAGNEEAFAELISRYRCFMRIRSSPPYFTGLDAEDMIQEGLIGLICAVRNFNPKCGASFRTYAYLCIKRRMTSALRSACRRKHMPLNHSVSLDDEANLKAAALASVINPEDMIVSREEAGAVKNIVEKCLTAFEREILNMYVSGASYADMAKACHVGVKAVDNSLQRIRKKLSLSILG